MSILNFDDAPIIGAEYIKDGYRWVWNGRGWVSDNNKKIPEATNEEAIAATETGIRSWSPAKILTLVENHSSESGPVIGNAIPLGLNSEGCLVTDSLELTEETMVTNAIALMNCILGRIVPKEPTRFPGSNTLSVNSLAQYRMTDFTQTDNANDNLNVAGGTIVNTRRVTAYDTNIIPQTGPGKNGTINVYKNKTISGSKVLTSNQDPITLLGSDNGTFDDLIITNDKDCSLVFTSIPSGFYQIIDVKANGIAVSGWNQIYIKHTGAGETNKVNWYVDLSSPGVPIFSNTTIINPPDFELSYSSTVPHLTTNNIFTLSFDLNRFSGDTYPLTDTYLTGVAAGAFLTPVSKTYQDSNIKTPLDKNYCVSSGYETITTTVGIRTGFGSSNLGPTLNTNNSYHAASWNFDPNVIILYKTGNSTPIDETNIAINSVGVGSGNGVRVINPGNDDVPNISNTNAFNSQNGPLQNYDATVVAAILSHDQINYGPSVGQTGVIITYNLAYTTNWAYDSGVLASNGDIHFIPYYATVGQKINNAGVVSTYNLAYTCDGAYAGGILASNGDIHFIPSSATVGQKISSSGVVSTYALAYTAGAGSYGGVLASNGDIHFIPYNATVGQKVNNTGVVSTYSLIYIRNGAYYDGVLASNGDIHFVPCSAIVGQKINNAGVVSTYSLAYTIDDAYCGGVLASNGDVHFVPGNATVGQKISSSGVVSTYALAYTTDWAYDSGVLAPNGDIHFIPYNARVGQKIDSSGVVSTYSLAYTTIGAYSGGLLDSNGDIHFVPCSATIGQKITKVGIPGTEPGMYLPIGPDLSQNRSNPQYFTFKFIRTVVAKFNINYTGTLAGLYIALPGSEIDNTSSLNGWLDASLPYNGIGLPGANSGGNGSNGCSVSGIAILNTYQNNKAVTVTFGTENSSNTLNNEILIRIKLTSGQSLTGLSINPATN